MNTERCAGGSLTQRVAVMSKTTTLAWLKAPNALGQTYSTRNMHFYDKNINDDSQTITEDRFL
jgi:hypothetical protein